MLRIIYHNCHIYNIIFSLNVWSCLVCVSLHGICDLSGGRGPMWHWLFATLSLPGKPSPSPMILSNEKQTCPGFHCSVTALSDFVLNPRACFETSRGYWKMNCECCGNFALLPSTATVKRTDSPWWGSASHLAKLTVSHPSVPTVPVE